MWRKKQWIPKRLKLNKHDPKKKTMKSILYNSKYIKLNDAAAVFWLQVPARGMSKRKLCQDDTPLEQFAALKKNIPGLQVTHCRKVVSMLNEDGKGSRTCSAASLQHEKTYPLLKEVAVKSSEGEKDQSMHMLSFPGLVQEKVNSCPLYKRLVQKALRENHNELTLIFYADEVNAGNILAPKHPRKANLTYCTFLELEVLFLESLWLTVSVILANEANRCIHGYCSVIRAQLEDIRRDTCNGFALCIDGDCSMVFLKAAVILGDHEGLRSLTGCKGAAGLKPCLKCDNVLSLHRQARDHVDVAEYDTAKIQEQSQNGLSAIQNMLERCTTKKDLAESETMSGWNLSALQQSFLNSPELTCWANINSVYFDVMHQYWSCGMIATELGLWYMALHNVHVTTIYGHGPVWAGSAPKDATLLPSSTRNSGATAQISVEMHQRARMPCPSVGRLAKKCCEKITTRSNQNLTRWQHCMLWCSSSKKQKQMLSEFKTCNSCNKGICKNMWQHIQRTLSVLRCILLCTQKVKSTAGRVCWTRSYANESIAPTKVLVAKTFPPCARSRRTFCCTWEPMIN